VTIREAIQELEMWAAQAEFSLADYRHSNGTLVKVVREWKACMDAVKVSEKTILILIFQSEFVTKI
jgi:hypothetical protein